MDFQVSRRDPVCLDSYLRKPYLHQCMIPNFLGVAMRRKSVRETVDPTLRDERISCGAMTETHPNKIC